MKAILPAVAVAILLATGCAKEADSPTDSSTNANGTAGNPLTAPADYLGAVHKAKQVSEKTVDMASLNNALQLFHAGEGRFPQSLNELVTEGYMGRLPDAPQGMIFTYNPATGQVRLVPAR